MKHPQNFYEPFHILNLYAPASSASARKDFFSRLASMLDTLQDDQTISIDSLIICGDFNYSLLRPRQYRSSTTDNWRILLETQFYNSMEANQMDKVPTFQRTRHAETSVWSVVNYIYLGQSFIHYLVRNDITRLNPNWSDHNVLQITLQLSSSPIGPGMWRANPAYASHKKLRRQLSLRLTQLVNDLTTSNLSDDYLWDSVKLEAKSIIRKYGVKYVGWRQERIKFLGKTRNRLLRSITDPIIRHKMVSPIDQELGDLQEEIAEIASVKAGQRWREQGEKSAGFLKRIFKERERQQHMASIIRNTPQGTQLTSNSSEIRLAVHDYYQSLYAKDPVDSTVLNTFLDDIDFPATVSTEENTSLTSEILLDDLLEQSKLWKRSRLMIINLDFYFFQNKLKKNFLSAVKSGSIYTCFYDGV